MGSMDQWGHLDQWGPFGSMGLDQWGWINGAIHSLGSFLVGMNMSLEKIPPESDPLNN